jgi:hypothetical protein
MTIEVLFRGNLNHQPRWGDSQRTKRCLLYEVTGSICFTHSYICLTHNKSSDVKARFLKMSMTIERGNEKN